MEVTDRGMRFCSRMFTLRNTVHLKRKHGAVSAIVDLSLLFSQYAVRNVEWSQGR
jgi:hypothetical protein